MKNLSLSGCGIPADTSVSTDDTSVDVGADTDNSSGELRGIMVGAFSYTVQYSIARSWDTTYPPLSKS